MWGTSARLLQLLALLQTPRDWTGVDLARSLEVDVRTVRRDIQKLRDLGYPVRATPGAAGYRLGAGTKLPPLLLDDDEAVAVAVGLRTAASGTITGIEDTSLRALVKLEQVLPSRVRHRIDLLHSVTVSVPATGPTVDPDVLTASPPPAASPTGSASTTRAMTAPTRCVTPNRTGSSIPAGAGT